MGLFKKRGSDVLDLTHLQERGLLKKAVVAQESPSVSSLDSSAEDYPDLGALAGSSSEVSQAFPGPESGTSGTEQTVDLGFLGSLAAGASSERVQDLESNMEESSIGDEQLKKVEHLKVKIEDLEYKLDRFLERLEKMEDQMIDKT